MVSIEFTVSMYHHSIEDRIWCPLNLRYQCIINPLYGEFTVSMYHQSIEIVPLKDGVNAMYHRINIVWNLNKIVLKEMPP